jgi:hypothetical protein
MDLPGPEKDKARSSRGTPTCPALGKSSIISVRIPMAVLASADEAESLQKLPSPNPVFYVMNYDLKP